MQNRAHNFSNLNIFEVVKFFLKMYILQWPWNELHAYCWLVCSFLFMLSDQSDFSVGVCDGHSYSD